MGGDMATPEFEPLRCRTPSYAAKFDAECFELYRQLPKFSFYGYKLLNPANCFFLALFSLSLLGFIGVAVYNRRTRGPIKTGLFTTVMCLGAICEIIGYAARIKSYRNRAAEVPFMIQVVCLTIGPAFTAAGIYVCLRCIVEAVGPSGSLVRPQWYTQGFFACDAASLALQGLGGGLASAALRAGRTKQPGRRVMLAGMVFQVASLLVFLALAAHFAVTTRRRYRRHGGIGFDRTAWRLQRSRRFRGHVAALVVSALCLLCRCVFHVAELSQGWSGPLMKRQDFYIAFEGVMVAVAVLGLNVFHPALCMSLGPKRPCDDPNAFAPK